MNQQFSGLFALFFMISVTSAIGSTARAADLIGDAESIRAVERWNTVQKTLAQPATKGCGSTSRAPSKSGCSESSGPITADDSPNKKYFEDLLKRGMSAPIGDFLKLWYPSNAADHLDSKLFACEELPWGNLQTDAIGRVEKSCSPDTLYSWGAKDKLQIVEQTMPDRKSWIGSPNPKGMAHGVFTSLSAVSTYGYGPILIRFKVRSSAQFQDVSEMGGPGQVGVRKSGMFHDFTFSDASVIESWSYGTPEIYDEVVRDIQRYESGKRATVYVEQPLYGEGLDRLYHVGTDGNAQNETTLKRNLLEMIREILAGEGRIFYSEGSCRNRLLEYKTKFPSYMNPNDR